MDDHVRLLMTSSNATWDSTWAVVESRPMEVAHLDRLLLIWPPHVGLACQGEQLAQSSIRASARCMRASTSVDE